MTRLAALPSRVIQQVAAERGAYGGSHLSPSMCVYMLCVCFALFVVCGVFVAKTPKKVNFDNTMWSTMDQRTSENGLFPRRIVFFYTPLAIYRRFRPRVPFRTAENAFLGPDALIQKS